MAIHAHFWQAILTQKVGQTDLVLVREKSSLEGLRRQDYKSLCAVATICHPGALFTKYLTTHIRLSYDNAEVTID